MASPKMLEIEMQKQLLRKSQVRILTPSVGQNRAGRRKMSWLASHLPEKQVQALLKLAVAKGFLKEEDLKKPDEVDTVQ